MHVVIFDLETTGLSPNYHEIIQIAAVKVRARDWEVTEAFETFVRPKARVPGFITSLTGITQKDVDTGPSIPEALTSFSHFVGDGSTLIAHNGQRFDMPFIRETCARHRMPVRQVGFIDSCHFSRKMWGGRGGHGLDAVLQRCGLSAHGVRRHDARGDVHLLAKAVRHMWNHLEPGCQRFPVEAGTGVIPTLTN